MGIFIAAIAKQDQSIEKLFADKLGSRQLENALNVNCDNYHVYSTPDKSAIAVNFVCGNSILKEAKDAVQVSSSYIGDDAIVVMHGNIVLRNTDLVDSDWLTARDVYKMLSDMDCETFRNKTTGDYSICYIKNDGTLFAFSDRLSVEHLYYSQDSTAIYISNRIRLIRTMLETSHTDLFALSHIALMGSVIGNDTSVSEIKRIPQGGYASVKNRVLSITENNAYFFNDDEVTERCASNFQQFVKDELNVCINKMTAALKNTDNFSLALSGGKDSRALLAMLLKTKYIDKVSVFTNGYEAHPDVVVSKMITEHYKLDHTVNIPNSISTGIMSIEDYMKKVLGSIFQTDGMIGLFNAKGYAKTSSQPLAFPGHVNEVFRGFKNDNVTINSLDDCVNYYKTIRLYDPLHIMKPVMHSIFEEKFRNRANKYASYGMSFDDVNDTYFICDRLPNWTGYLQRTDGYSTPQVQVLNNDNLIKAFWRQNCCEMRESELLHFMIMSDFDKWLAECPFAAQVWSPSLAKWAGDVNISAQAVPLPKGLPMHGTWQHMINTSADVKIRFLEILKSYDNSEIWDLFDKTTIEKALLSRTNSYTQMISLYGFMTMFFYHHKVELPMKMFKDTSEAAGKKVRIAVEGEKTIYCYDNNNVSKFSSYDAFVNSGLAGTHGVEISRCAINSITD